MRDAVRLAAHQRGVAIHWQWWIMGSILDD